MSGLGLISKRLLGRVSSGGDLKASSARISSRWFNEVGLVNKRLVHNLNRSRGVLQQLQRQQNEGAAIDSMSQQQQTRAMSMLDVFRRKKKTEAVNEESDDDDEAIGQIFELQDDSIRRLSEEEIEAKRNISRLRTDHRNLVHGKLPDPEPRMWFQHTLKYKRRMYGLYGESSGVDPGLLWPTEKELQERIEYERVSNPFTIQEMAKKKQALRAAEREEFEQREKEIESRMQLVEKFKKELFDKHKAKEDELEAAKQRREKLMEEVRRHFGYTVDPKDERFQEMLAKKEKEQKKAMKEARKLEKQKRTLDRLQGVDQEKPKEAKGRKRESKPVEDDD